ncbi:hypothetical protein SCUCBS95973_006816 [Sporothrix curviconia]|uniref:C2H2-type domain-containing protein n=1 Tax=Sporothrix curviconia TaxID=1260050 RepID=A0ABP0C8A5_9PEZI
MDNKRSRDADIEAASASGKRMRLDRAASPVGSNDIISVAHEALFRSHGNDNNARKRKNNFTTIESILATPPDTGPTYDDENDNATGNDNYGTANAQTSEYDGAFSGQNSNDASTANNGSNNSYPPIDRAPPGVLIEITRSFQQAVSTGRHRRSPTYVDADVMIVYWEEDYEEVKSSTKLLGSVFQHSFYYATEVFAIPSINPEQALYIAVEEFFAKNSTPEKLAILYYAGRSAPSEPSGGPPLWMPQPLDQQQQQQQQEQQRLSQQGLSRQLVESGLSEKDALLVAAAQKPFKISIKLAGQNHMCNECKAGFKDIESLRNHVRKQHTRPFHCVFNWAGCESTFASKNEWKRHVMSQHILLHFWVCQNELCSKMVTKAPAAHDSFSMPDGAIFNRKDLFTQHLRRMHTPAHVKKLMKQAKNANKPPNHPAILEWENKMKELQQAGIKPRCRLPDFMSCPSPGCGVDFHGSNAWDDRMEHVARHLEGAAAGRETLVTFGRKSDPTLTDWATRPEVGIAKRIGPNAWCLDNPLRPEILEWTGDDDDDADGPPIIRKIDPRGPRLPFEEYNEKEDEEHPEDEASPPSDTHPADDRSSREGSRSVIEVADPDSPIADDYSDSDPEKSGDREEATSSGQTAEGKQPAKDKDHFEEDTATRREPTPETRQSPREESSPSIVVSQ